MERLIQEVLSAMVTYETGSPKRIQHFIKVYTFSKLIGLREGLDPQTQLILETTAAVHDIGIRKSLEVYGSYTGKTQEELGPAEADALLTSIGFPREIIDRVCWIVGRHHTYTDIQGLDYQILVEADFLVNLYEKDEGVEAQRAAYEKIFRTGDRAGQLCRDHFPGRLPDLTEHSPTKTQPDKNTKRTPPEGMASSFLVYRAYFGRPCQP